MRSGIFIIGLAALAVSGCSSSSGTRSTTVVVRQDINELERSTVPGTVNDVWTEPMVDSIRIPGQIDPRGTYYRKSHHTLVEIRPGRYQMVEYPEDRTSSDEFGK